MDFAAHVDGLLEHYTRMAGTCPAWKRYAWDRVKELAAQCPSLYAELPARLTEAMNQSSPPLS